MTNLYDFLRRVKGDATGTPPFTVNITAEELAWLETFIQPADHELHFKAKRQPGGDDDNPIYAQDFMIAGSETDIFCLLTEVMLQNSTFASLVMAAAKFFQDHVPNCPECKAQVLEAATREVTAWIFSPHKPIADQRESPCSECPTGEMIPGMTQPNGSTHYVCNVCGHNETFP